MISHQLKCIFVHIPRCAGTSVEQWLDGHDTWEVSPDTKHLTARQAMRVYRPYWDNYFKFSIVRHPFTRFASCLKYADFFGLSVDGQGDLDFSGYHLRFGTDVVLEYDYRFHRIDDVRFNDHTVSSIYGNILDAPLDAVYRYETLDDDMASLRKLLGVSSAFPSFRHEASRSDSRILTDNDKAYLSFLCERDFQDFNYEPFEGDPGPTSLSSGRGYRGNALVRRYERERAEVAQVLQRMETLATEQAIHLGDDDASTGRARGLLSPLENMKAHAMQCLHDVGTFTERVRQCEREVQALTAERVVHLREIDDLTHRIEEIEADRAQRLRDVEILTALVEQCRKERVAPTSSRDGDAQIASESE